MTPRDRWSEQYQSGCQSGTNQRSLFHQNPLITEYLYSDPSSLILAQPYPLQDFTLLAVFRSISQNMAATIQILLGTLAFSLIHILIPTHWVPLVAIGKAEAWSRQETLWTTAITGLTHTISTLLLGIVVGLLSYHLSDHYEALTQLLTPLVLVGLGAFYLSQGQGQADTTHDHAMLEPVARQPDRSKWAVILPLVTAMFFSPCLEVGAFYLSAGSLGWLEIALVSAVYLGVTVLGMVLMVNWGWCQTEQLSTAGHSLGRFDGNTLTGAILIALGCFNVVYQVLGNAAS